MIRNPGDLQDPELTRPLDPAWRKFGPYLSERQWGTVREDYSPHGDAWNYFPYAHAHCRAYRWGEDGIAGFSDDQALLCLSLALWNGKDSHLKERLFGLTNAQGNHGEDVKELYYYLDATPSHSYLKLLYKYPQSPFPYEALLAHRGPHDPELELWDTGIFDHDAYFDVFVEYAKAGPEDIFMQVTAHNRGRAPAPLYLLPQVGFRNTWSWNRGQRRPTLSALEPGLVRAEHPQLGDFYISWDTPKEVIFTHNETNVQKLYGQAAPGPFKDGFHDYLVGGRTEAIHFSAGTKAAGVFYGLIPPGGSMTARLRLDRHPQTSPFAEHDAVLACRRAQADRYYADLQRDLTDPDARLVQRQAFAGMIWSKQYYAYNLTQWLEGDPGHPAPAESRRFGRNKEWLHLQNADIISMPDKWEYPWYAAWDLAFHCLPLAVVDAEFAKQQLVLLTREWYMHPNGQLPAYEWALGDVNPPVHAWATWRVYQLDKKQQGKGDLFFLERVFHKLLLNFTWWVNRKDAEGRNVFQGGFLGLDNIGVFDRSAPLPTGGHLDQADGTAWMAMYSVSLLRIALELAKYDTVYEDIATKFFEHFLHIAGALNNIGGTGTGLWHQEDKFYYDVLHFPDGTHQPLKVRSMVGLIPLFAVETLEPELLEALPEFHGRLRWLMENRPDLASLVSRWEEEGRGQRHLLSLLRGHRMKRLLFRMLDESEFLSPYGVRALSKYHHSQPYVFSWAKGEIEVRYQPGESDSRLFGGNSNWRGPIWFPVNYLVIESLQKFHHYYGDDFKVECPTGSGTYLTLAEIAQDLTRRLSRLFLAGPDGRRPALTHFQKMGDDPHFRDYLLFHEYFHGDTGLGLGAAHQTGWTGLIAKLLMPRKPEQG